MVASKIGRRLATARLQRGLSQGSLARLTGIAPSYISRIETGKVNPTLKTAQRIAEVLKISLEVVAGSEESTDERRGRCPVSAKGHCLIDLIHSELEVQRGKQEEAYSPRQIRLLRNFATWLRGARSDRVKAMEILLGDLSKSANA